MQIFMVNAIRAGDFYFYSGACVKRMTVHFNSMVQVSPCVKLNKNVIQHGDILI